MNILTRPSFERAVRKLTPEQCREVNEAVTRLPELFGFPHRHSGLGLRRLRPRVFEIRAGLKLRIVFVLSEGSAVLSMVGDHEDVRAWLRENA